MHAKCFICVQLCVTLRTVALQAPLSMGLSRQKYWSGLPCPPQGTFLTQGSNLRLLQWHVASLPLLSPGGSHSKEAACNVGDLGLTPELGRPPGEGKGYPLPYSGLENSTVQSMGLQRVIHSGVTFTFTLQHHLGTATIYYEKLNL